jgi:hypothetical protein
MIKWRLNYHKILKINIKLKSHLQLINLCRIKIAENLKFRSKLTYIKYININNNTL